MFLLFDSAICLVLYDKRFGLLQEKVDEEAMNFIAAVKTVSALLILPRGEKINWNQVDFLIHLIWIHEN